MINFKQSEIKKVDKETMSHIYNELKPPYKKTGISNRRITMKVYINKEEIDVRIKLNFSRLSDSEYDIDNVFKGDDASWPGDWEGRALLAFVSLYKINSAEIPCMKLMIEKIPEVTENKCYFGEKTGDVIFEQQLSGHSWYLRGLCEYYEQFKDERVIEYLNKTFEDVYLPTKGRYSTYPLERVAGDVGAV